MHNAYMIDFRLYRLAFIPALLAVIVVMFSLEGRPDALEPVTPPSTFEGDRAVALARQIAETAPDRTPGSEDDSAVADLVIDHFKDIPAGAVSEQRFSGTYRGDDVSLRNILLTLPGDTERTILIAAPRDTAGPPGAASSAAATGVLVELANAFRVSHTNTFVLASVDGSEASAAGIRQLLSQLPERASIDSVIVISQPGAATRQAPFAVDTSSGTHSGSVQLERTAEQAIEVQAGEPASESGWFTQLARLAIPSGLGDQAPLIADGVDAVAVSSAGERPLASDDDQIDDLSQQSVSAFGRAIQSTVSALDAAPDNPIHGPSTHIELGSNMVPGWALAALALMLILPVLVAAVDGCARAARNDLALGAALAWAAARSLPLIGALGILYALAIVGAIPRPQFPFDPNLYGLGARGAIAFVLMALVAGASAWLLRSRGISARAAPDATVCGLGVVSALAALLTWLANPYLALLTVPLAHVWLAGAGELTNRRRIAIVVACAVASIPLLAAIAAVAHALELGASTPWTLSLMVADGQIGLAIMVAACFTGGCLLGLLALALRRNPPPPGTGLVGSPQARSVPAPSDER